MEEDWACAERTRMGRCDHAYQCIWYRVDNPLPLVGRNFVKMSSQSISIHVGRETSKVSLHYLPCKVECDCEGDTSKDPSSERGRRPAEVDCFFEPVIREGSGTIRMGAESSTVLTATFRGRLLKGAEISVPEGYGGVVLREQGTVSHDSQVLKETLMTLRWVCIYNYCRGGSL